MSEQIVDVQLQSSEAARLTRQPGFRDPNEAAGREVSIKLLREILECQQHLNELAEQSRPGSPNLINAYRRAIRIRREMLRDLPDHSPRSAADHAVV